VLTTSVNPDDELKARSIKEITEFKTKPMTSEMLEQILSHNFSNYLY